MDDPDAIPSDDDDVVIPAHLRGTAAISLPPVLALRLGRGRHEILL
jgi:hypothetical protein